MDSNNYISHLEGMRSITPPPNVSDLRIVLLGKKSSEISRVGNFILDREAFDTEVSSSSVQQKSKRARRKLEGRSIILINTPHLFDPHLSTEELTQRVRESISLCSPGPHAFLLVLQSENFTVQDQDRIRIILNMFSPLSIKYSIVLTTGEGYGLFATRRILSKFIRECEGRHHQIQDISTFDKYQVLQLLEKIDQVARMNGGDHLTCEINEKPKLEIMEKRSVTTGPAYSTEMMKDGTRGGRKTDERKGDESSTSECLRIVLIGKTGNGKSSTANMILGRSEFECNASMTSVTTRCQKSFGKVLGKSVSVVDTPGLFDTTLSNDEVTKEIVKCISLSAPGPHVFIIVLSVGRFTDEEMETLDLIKETFGSESSKFSLVLFTRGDELVNETLEQYIRRSNHSDMNELIRDCGGRVHMFNNKEMENQTQVRELFRKIEDMKKVNKNSFFTNDMLELAERTLQQKTAEVLREKKKEIQEREEAVLTEYNKGVEEMKVNMIRNREKVEVERYQWEKEFKERLQALRRSFEKNDEEKCRWRKDEKTHFVKEQKEERKRGEWGMEWRREEEKEHERTDLRPAEKLRESSVNLKQMIAAFEESIEKERLQRHLERQQWKKTERIERGKSEREKNKNTLQTTKDNERQQWKKSEMMERDNEREKNEKTVQTTKENERQQWKKTEMMERDNEREKNEKTVQTTKENERQQWKKTEMMERDNEREKNEKTVQTTKENERQQWKKTEMMEREHNERENNERTLQTTKENERQQWKKAGTMERDNEKEKNEKTLQTTKENERQQWKRIESMERDNEREKNERTLQTTKENERQQFKKTEMMEREHNEREKNEKTLQTTKENERQQWKKTEGIEREHNERENNERTLQRTKKRNEEEEKRTEHFVDNEINDEERRTLEKLELERQWQEELRKRDMEDRMRREKEEEEREELKKEYEEKMNKVKVKYEEEARHQAEQFNDIKVNLENEISELVKKHKTKRKAKKPTRRSAGEKVKTEDKEQCTLL